MRRLIITVITYIMQSEAILLVCAVLYFLAYSWVSTAASGDKALTGAAA